MTFAAQLMTWPIIASTFHQLSLIGLFVNILVLWTVPIIMIAGAFTITVSLLVRALGILLALIPNVLLTYFIYVVTFFDSVGYLYIGKVPFVVWIGYYIFIVGLYLILRKSKENSMLDDKNMMRFS